jgi:hypothetical protein
MGPGLQQPVINDATAGDHPGPFTDASSKAALKR